MGLRCCRSVVVYWSNPITKSDGRRDDVESVPILHRNLRRRFASSNAASQSWSSSVSLNCVTAWLRFLGRTCRCVDVSAAVSVATIGFDGDEEVSRTLSVENKSGAACSVGSRPMASSCSEEDWGNFYLIGGASLLPGGALGAASDGLPIADDVIAPTPAPYPSRPIPFLLSRFWPSASAPCPAAHWAPW